VADSVSNKNEKTSEMNMQANAIDQSNVNHQSNMTLSAHSMITQTYHLIKITDAFTEEEVGEHEY
jgi:hypothetical protein